jgi:hypothetical protein
MWEVIIHAGDPQRVREVISAIPEPIPEPEMVKKYLNERIQLTKELVQKGKLDRRIGDAAVKHFETHLKELQSVT